MQPLFILSLSLSLSSGDSPTKVKSEASTSSGSCSQDPRSPKESISGVDYLSGGDSPITIEPIVKEELSSTPGTGAEFLSPSASPVSESSFPKISDVYHSAEEQFIADNLGTEAQSIAVSPNNVEEAKYYPESATSTENYVIPSSTDSSNYYSVSSYASAYPTPTYNAGGVAGAGGSDLYSNACISPNYLGSYPSGTSKAYTWPTTPNGVTGVGYGAFTMPPTDMYHYQAQTAAYQQMASKSQYPTYFTGQSSALPHTLS